MRGVLVKKGDVINAFRHWAALSASPADTSAEGLERGGMAPTTIAVNDGPDLLDAALAEERRNVVAQITGELLYRAYWRSQWLDPKMLLVNGSSYPPRIELYWNVTAQRILDEVGRRFPMTHSPWIRSPPACPRLGARSTPPGE